MFFRKKSHKAKWRFKEVFAITIRKDIHTWEFTHYDPDETPDAMLDDHITPYARKYEYIMPLKGWNPGTKYDNPLKKFKRSLMNFFKPHRMGLILFSEDFTDGEGKMMPISHSAAYTGESDDVTPEFFQKVCESKLAANFSRSLDTKQMKLNWIIIAIVIIVALGIFLKVSGAL